MNLKQLFLSLMMVFFLSAFMVAEEARLMRFPGISNDKIVFTYAGDLYTVDIEGGIARKITSHNGMEMFARFSPDGSKIAFTGQYDGNTEVFVVPAEGGVPKRLTFTATLGRDDVADRMGPNNIVIAWTPDSKNIVFRTRKNTFNSFKGQLYKVSVEGGMPEQLPFPEGGFSSFNADGGKLAYNRVFREFRTWKYYRGGMADEVWIHDFDTHETEAITQNDAQDIFPMWIEDEVFFISDRDRTMNLFVYNTKTETTEKLTDFTDFDIKFPSHHGSTIVFEKGGQLFSYDTRAKALNRIPVIINNDMNESREELKEVSGSIASASLSPQGERILFSARGDLFSVPAEDGITYNHTQTSGVHDRNAQYSPDGNWMGWLSDRSGEYEVWIKPANGEGDARQLTTGADTYKFSMQWSPDSKFIVWNDQNYRLMLTNVSSGNTHTLAESNYSRLGDFSWSPDSKWIAFTDGLPNQMDVIKIVNIETKTTEAITEKWYDSGYPSFSADGKYLLFTSQRDFSPVYSRTEWNHAYINTYRVYMTMLDKATPSPFAPENQDVKPLDKKEDENDENEENDEKTGKEAIVDIDFDGIRSRIVALPIDPANYYNINCVDGKVYYIRRYQNKEEGAGLFVFDLDKEKETLLGDYNYTLSADNKKMLVGKNSTWDVIDLPSFAVNIEEAVDLSNMKMHIDYKAEWQQIFDEAWRQMRDFFYVENMHGQDWKGIYDKYSSLVPYVNHRNDLNYIIGEMIGELNAGHAYVNTGDKTQPKRIQTGLLGANIEAHESGYFRIAEILDGAPWSEKMNSPLQSPGVDVSEGDYILEIDRKSTKEVDNIYQLLVGKADKTVELLVNETPGTEGAEKILVKPISDESELNYFKWVNENIRKVEEATDGKIGYIHIPDMGPNGLNKFVRFFYPQLDKQGLIIDDRGNGGGNVSPMILERLAREAYRANMRRNSTAVTPIPAQTLIGPKVALIDKYSASDGDLFAHGFKALGIGTTIGTRTWGGIVGITGSLPFVDGTDLRIPQFTSISMNGDWMIEGVGVEPDIIIENDPWKEFNGEDEQLNKAVELILQKLKERKPLPEIPEAPVK
ncbi:tricorn protease [Marinilabilia salmonicolor]|jgi:tricorn protease|uniref:S41 family peptidase n=1 Tax=Marinilabilia salmonicolor TaxID=989 RepID=UPI000D04D282|nr:S41 family peptidase [Marinilabilia salmonicolor]PRZ00056.1 tricorn protease [Marinilabilia salmonicolor]